MEIWLIYALLSVVVCGSYNFAMKVVSNRNYNVSIINRYSYLISAFLWFIYFLSNYRNYEVWSIKFVILLSFLSSFLFSLSVFSRVKSMKNIDSVIFFPIYKTIWPIIVTTISILFFKEILTTREIIWIIIGVSVPLLLITKKEHSIQKNLLIWLIFILITAILTSWVSSVQKIVMSWEYNSPLFVLFVSIFWTLFAYITFLLNRSNNHTYNEKWVIKFSVLVWFLSFFWFFTFLKALDGWNLAVVYTINSFSILVPIILSIFFYKEHFNLRKALVILLSIISIILFI